MPADRDRSDAWAHRRRLLEVFTGIPATEGNQVDVLRNGEEIFPAMLEAIKSSRYTIDFLTFVYWRGDVADRFAQALTERARAGVRVRVLLDSFGARPMDPGHRQALEEAGAQFVEFRPVPSLRLSQMNMRTHRRVLVCDETVAFTGGVGIAQEWETGGDSDDAPPWRDTHFRVCGPAVAGIHAAFLANWLETDHRVLGAEDRFPEQPVAGSSTVQVVRASSQLGWNAMAIAMQGLLEVARSHVRVTSAYFRPPASFREAMIAAAQRGVRVDVLVPGPHAHPAHYRLAGEHSYEELLDAGVRIFHYQPTMLHAKILTVDGEVALIGTTNLDARSIAMNEQIGLVIHDAEVTATLDRHFTEDMRESLEADPEAWRRRSFTRRVEQFASHALTYPIRGAGAAR